MSTEATGPTRESVVTLREVTLQNLGAVFRLETTPEQRNFVARNAESIAEAHFSPHAWFRAIYAGETPVGFVMLRDDPDTPKYYLWRFMIAAPYQRMGFGAAALHLVIDYVRTRPNATHLTLGYVPEPGGPGPFYARLGFVETGEVHGDEREMRLDL